MSERYPYECCRRSHSRLCNAVAPAGPGKDSRDCARVILRLPDISTFPDIPAAVTTGSAVARGNSDPASKPYQHTAACFSIADADGDHFFVQKLFNILIRCEINGAVIEKLRELVEESSRWHVRERAPGLYIEVAVIIEWRTILRAPNEMLKKLHALGVSAAEFTTPLYRHHVPLSFNGLSKLFPKYRIDAAAVAPDPMGSQLLQYVEHRHAAVLPAIAAFINTGEEDAYNMYAADPYVKPTLASLQAAIEVSRFVVIQLKPYQIATIAWALDREQEGQAGDCTQIREVPARGAEGACLYFDYAYGRWGVTYEDVAARNITRGGFILEEMGMGKTVEMLCVIIAADHMQTVAELDSIVAPAVLELEPASPKKRRSRKRALDIGIVPASTTSESVAAGDGNEPVHAESKSEDPIPNTSTKTPCFSYSGIRRPETNGGTLIIVPLSLMHQWAHEIAITIKNGPLLLRPMLYHGGSRHSIDPATLVSSPIVITSYETVTADDRAYRSREKRVAAAAQTTWSCPGTLHLAELKHQHEPLAVHDVVLLSNGAAYEVIKIVSDSCMYTLPYFGENADDSSKTLPVADATTCIPANMVKCASVHALVRIGARRACYAVHESTIANTCGICDTNCHDLGLQQFLGEMLTPPLESVTWQRIVLDESHKIQCTSTCQFRCISRLKTPLKWCLSGTPMPKAAENLRGQLEFLHIVGPKLSKITIPWLASSMIRHTKETCLLDASGATSLPPVTYREIVVELSAEDKAAYAAEKQQTRLRYESRGEGDPRFYQKMFQCITRERRACTVASKRDFLSARGTSASAACPAFPEIPEDALNVDDDCPICLEAIPHAVTLPCRHCFCHECLQAALATGNHKCPLCKRLLTGAQVSALQKTCRDVVVAMLYSALPPLPETHETASEAALGGPICAVKFEALRGLVTHGVGRPTLVFSQFDDTVHTLQALFRQAEPELPVQILTGSTTREGRERAIRSFREAASGVFILSLRSAAVGLNLIHANRVVFMEPPMNSGLEAQACGRVHRLGQVSCVEVIHLIAAGTIEERIRNFRDIDASATENTTSIRVGNVSVIMTENQRRQWRETWLENLMQLT